jgi:hypothetical protein
MRKTHFLVLSKAEHRFFKALTFWNYTENFAPFPLLEAPLWGFAPVVRTAPMYDFHSSLRSASVRGLSTDTVSVRDSTRDIPGAVLTVFGT